MFKVLWFITLKLKTTILVLVLFALVHCKFESNNFKVVLTQQNFQQLLATREKFPDEKTSSQSQENATLFMIQSSQDEFLIKLHRIKTQQHVYIKLIKSENLLKVRRNSQPTSSENECFYGNAVIYTKVNVFQHLPKSWAALTICEHFMEGFLLLENVGFLLESQIEDKLRRETREANVENLSNLSFRSAHVSSKSFFNLTGDTQFDSHGKLDHTTDFSPVAAPANYEVNPLAPVAVVGGSDLGTDQKRGGGGGGKRSGNNKANRVYTSHVQGGIDSHELNFTIRRTESVGVGDSKSKNTSQNFNGGGKRGRLDYESWLMEQNDEELGYFYDSAWKSVITRNRNHNKSKNPHRFLEIIIAVDESVIRFHGRVRVKQYVLTLMNIVNALYQDPSLEANLQIVIRELHLYEKKRNVIRLGNAKNSLENVNLWNRDLHQVYGDDDEPHDIALWLTRTDIGGPSGYAPVGGVCDPERSCALTRDEGLTCAFIIAHELAHVLGLSHDGDNKNNNTCRDESLQGSVMAPMVSATFHHFLWSECSRREFASKVNKWQCLLNPADARRSIELNSTLGARFTMDEQCRVEFGDGYELCRSFDIVEPCAHLWCAHVNSPLVCKTKKGPPLEGTECGPHKWCVDGYCDTTLRLNLDPLKYNSQDGGWSAWGTWTSCSRSCGLGMQFRPRTCDNPRPAYGGRDCEGLPEDWRVCNTQECPENRDFRAQQCIRMPHLLEVPKNLTWLPYESHQHDLKCNYICQSKETSEIYASEEFLTDGTLCSYDWDNNRCVQGKCVTIGCDDNVNSTLIKDGCGVCNGNNSQCLRIKSHINKKIKKQITRLGVLHNQARHIAIEFALNQDNPDGNAGSGDVAQIDFDLFLKDRKRNAFRIRKSPFVGEFNRLFASPIPRPKLENNEHPNDVPMDDSSLETDGGATEQDGISITIVHGAKFRFHALETANALLPHNESLFLSTQGPLLKEMVLFIEIRNYRQHKGLKLKMDMEYVLHKKFKETRYEWIVGGWGSCSTSCGGGKRFKTKACAEKSTRRIVARKFCSIVNKPPTQVQTCNDFSCNFVWIPGTWEPCSATCGTNGVQHREIYCVPQNLLNNSIDLHKTPWKYMLPPNKCGYEPPVATRACNRTMCPGHWEYTTWSHCSSSCGIGEQSRDAVCKENIHDTFQLLRNEIQTKSSHNNSEVVCTQILDGDWKVQAQTCSNRNSEIMRYCDTCKGDASPFCELQSSLKYCQIESFRELCCHSCNLLTSMR